MGNFTRLRLVKFFPFPIQHSWYLSQISLLPMLLHIQIICLATLQIICLAALHAYFTQATNTLSNTSASFTCMKLSIDIRIFLQIQAYSQCITNITPFLTEYVRTYEHVGFVISLKINFRVLPNILSGFSWSSQSKEILKHLFIQY